MANELKVTAVPGQPTITMTREFDAPRDLVFRCHTDPAMVSQWWGPRDYTTVVDRMKAEKGGTWRFIQRGKDGEFAFNGVYHDVVAPERIIYTFEFEPMPGHVLLETLTFEEKDGKTVLHDLSVFQSVEDRDGMMQAGMESGAKESMDRLDELLKALS
jgi:uncharacterized protein YndB with AHSA1/START domain